MNTILDNLKPCTGCSACSTVCPKDAISCRIDENGFYTATVNPERCVNCGKCQHVCIKFLPSESMGIELTEAVLYSAQTKNEAVLKSCTSGGIAYELAEYGIENGYTVTGVVYDCSVQAAKAILLDGKTLSQSKGSKYLQALTEECFREIVRTAKEKPNSKFMVFGTPCQILGIKKSFEENRLSNELITIDLLCHGVPSYLMWSAYLQWLEKKHGVSRIDDIVFRSKKNGWHDFTMEIRSDGKAYLKSSEYDLFYRAFFDNVLLNSSCLDCKVRQERSAADIRLGDFWGKKYQDRQDGVSAVLCFTKEGQHLLDILNNKKRISLSKEDILVDCLKNQSTRPYSVINLQSAALESLKSGKPLVKVMKGYRKSFSVKRKLKLRLKEGTAYLPAKIRKKMRCIYRKSV